VDTYELGHEGNHEVEKTDGLDESETQNGVREELATEGGVAGNAVEESGEDETDTDTGTSQADGGGTHADVLGNLNHGLGDLRGVGTALDGEGLAGGGVDGRHLLALDGLEGRAGDCREGRKKSIRLDHWPPWIATTWLRLPQHGRARLTGEGALAGVGKGGTGSRAGGLGGHLRGQSRGEDTGGGHCDCVGRVCRECKRIGSG